MAETGTPADLLDIARTHLIEGRPNEALDTVSRALPLKDDPDARALFVSCVRAADRIPGAPAFRRLVTRALRETWGRTAGLTGPAIALITGQPVVAAAIRTAMAEWPRRLSPGECGAVINTLANDDLFRALLDTALVNDPGLERLLMGLRSVLLHAASHPGKASRETLALACSLARQCFNNEYVFAVAETEKSSVAWVRTSVRAALASRAAVPDIQIVALAAYAPLHTLERDEALLARSGLKFVDALINEQVREPQHEASLRAAMPCLTAIGDPVSQQVRQQYEENPYPRWVSLAATPPKDSIAAHVRELFPLAPLSGSAEPAQPDILIAGCGTGQQSIGTAQRFPHAKVLAVDLSLASLAYAKRKSEAADVTIDYAQGDILELGTDRTFDMIESTGVLHHLAEPMRGWSALISLLKPGGFMRIGLYSELGRTDVVTLRTAIETQGYSPTLDDIRRCRQEIISQNDARFAPIVRSPDFCSTSACRDLLFHVQEHRLTLPQIAEFLSQHGLSFIGFELDPATHKRYSNVFPDDPASTDLANWHRFETANPDTFRAMYQFWVRKAL